MINIGAVIHASTSNTSAVYDIPVTFEAHHPSGESYLIDETQYIDHIAAYGGTGAADVNWTPYADGVYIIEAEIGPGFSDDNGGNNEATRAIQVGEVTFVAVFDVNERTRIDRTIFRYRCWIIMDNLSPLDIENVQLELVEVPENMLIVDPYTNFSYIEAEGSAISEDMCVIDVNRAEAINPAEIIWQITYDIPATGEATGQMSSTMVQFEPDGFMWGDITGEGIVDYEDLALLVEDWLQPGSLTDICPPEGDDFVNFKDFAILAENWLK